ncbi:MAG: DNA polymerase I [Candidatus Brocadiae bacterium]|nr:DNA polymerase I [Candidatus Brocadiia bacterium]
MPETLFAVDAYAHIYQFFYAIKGLTGPDGEPVNAVYGFARMLENLRRDYGADYLVVAFDGPGKLVRSEVYEQYKANRPPMPEPLQRQIPVIRELLEVQGIPQLSAEGHEADDVLAAVAKQAARKGINTVIVTTDKDAEQLIDERTSVLHIHKDRELLLGPEELIELKGVEPWQVIEVMSLAGDPTDNVPGVPGIGPKTALKLIQQFGSVENLYANLDQVKSESLRQKLLDHREDMELAADLVRLNPEIPVELDLQQCRTGKVDPAELQQFYEALGFRSFRRDTARPTAEAGQTALFGQEAEPEVRLDTLESLEKDYSTVTGLEALGKLVETLSRQETIAVDLETTSLQPRAARIVGFAFAWRPHQAVYVATGGPPREVFCPLEEAIAALRPILESESPGKVGQNLKYDMAVLKNYGVELNGLRCDSMVASYLLHPASRSHGLDALARRHLNYSTVKIAEVIGKGSKQVTMDAVPIEKVAPYACEDADVALQLSKLLTGQLQEQGLWELFTRLELPLVPVLAEMEWVGVKVDTGQLADISKEFEAKLAELAKEVFREAGREFNLNSPQQLSKVLFEELRLPAPAGGRRKTGYSTASDVLTGLKDRYPIASHVLEHRELSKLKSTYADTLMEMVNANTGRVHTSFNQTVTATGRLSSSDPNLQNIPVRTPLGRRIRRAFVAGAQDMSLLGADYSQVELRILAHCSADPTLCEAFEQDRDIHRFVAAQVNDVPEDDVTDQMRQQAKSVNFGIIYGLSPYGLSRQIGVAVPEAERFIRSYFERYPEVKHFIGKTIDQARRDGCVRTLAGRKRTIEGIEATGAARSAAERIAVNTVIQGSAADLIKLAMIEIHRGLPAVSSRAQMLIQIHDELVFEVPDAEMDRVRSFVTEKMTNALKLTVPLKVHTAAAKNWADAK